MSAAHSQENTLQNREPPVASINQRYLHLGNEIMNVFIAFGQQWRPVTYIFISISCLSTRMDKRDRGEVKIPLLGCP